MQNKTKSGNRTLYIVLAVLLVGGLSFLFTQSEFLKGAITRMTPSEITVFGTMTAEEASNYAAEQFALMPAYSVTATQALTDTQTAFANFDKTALAEAQATANTAASDALNAYSKIDDANTRIQSIYSNYDVEDLTMDTLCDIHTTVTNVYGTLMFSSKPDCKSTMNTYYEDYLSGSPYSSLITPYVNVIDAASDYTNQSDVILASLCEVYLSGPYYSSFLPYTNLDECKTYFEGQYDIYSGATSGIYTSSGNSYYEAKDTDLATQAYAAATAVLLANAYTYYLEAADAATLTSYYSLLSCSSLTLIPDSYEMLSTDTTASFSLEATVDASAPETTSYVDPFNSFAKNLQAITFDSRSITRPDLMTEGLEIVESTFYEGWAGTLVFESDKSGLFSDSTTRSNRLTIPMTAEGSETVTYEGGIAGETITVSIEGEEDPCSASFTITQAGAVTPAGVTVTESSGTTAVTEGSTTTDSYTLALDTAPTADVTVTITPDAQVTVSTSTLTFTSTDWATAQTVTVTAVDDTTVEGTHSGAISHVATSTDTSYSGITIASVTASITDNDTATAAGVTITESGSTTTVTEGGSTDTYTVVLNTAPTSDVSVTVTPDSQVTVSNATLTFTSTNWATAQTVTVTAVDDTLSETSQTGTIKHTATSTDTSYSGITITSVTASITDNDSTDPLSKEYVCEDPFVDNTEPWSKDLICRMYQLGYISGRQSDLVVANDEMTRAEWVKVMVLVYGFDPDTDAEGLTTEFTDVSEDDWFYEYIVIAEHEDGIRIRDAGTEFRPNDPIDRAFALVVAARMGGLTSTSYDVAKRYSDVNNSDYFAYALAIASEKTVDVPVTQADGTVIMIEDAPVIEGYEDGTFRPYNYMSRAEAMALGLRVALAWGVDAE